MTYESYYFKCGKTAKENAEGGCFKKNLRSFANPLTCEVVIPVVFVARLRTVFKFLSSWNTVHLLAEMVTGTVLSYIQIKYFMPLAHNIIDVTVRFFYLLR